MIVKELERIEATDPLSQAGFRAESQLAHYLKREFQDDPLFLVFNNLRLEKAGDACQIDHLVLHRHGMIIIESKSVTTRVEINEFGEWKRWLNNAWQGMPSPILQAQRQEKFLKDYIEEHCDTLLDKVLFGRQAHFTNMPINVLIAISDAGIIDRHKNDKLDMVCKAEQISDRVKSLVAEYRKLDSLQNIRDLQYIRDWQFNKAPIKNWVLQLVVRILGLFFLRDSLNSKVCYVLGTNEISKISDFLLTQHKPINPNVHGILTTNPPSKPSKFSDIESVPTSQNTCSHCQSKNLSIKYGFSYYFKCNDCNRNTPIRIICSCGDLERTRKSALRFFTECEKCGTSRLLHTNNSVNG